MFNRHQRLLTVLAITCALLGVSITAAVVYAKYSKPNTDVYFNWQWTGSGTQARITVHATKDLSGTIDGTPLSDGQEFVLKPRDSYSSIQESRVEFKDSAEAIHAYWNKDCLENPKVIVQYRSGKGWNVLVLNQSDKTFRLMVHDLTFFLFNSTGAPIEEFASGEFRSLSPKKGDVNVWGPADWCFKLSWNATSFPFN